jgi:hypothetical protein
VRNVPVKNVFVPVLLFRSFLTSHLPNPLLHIDLQMMVSPAVQRNVPVLTVSQLTEREILSMPINAPGHPRLLIVVILKTNLPLSHSSMAFVA